MKASSACDLAECNNVMSQPMKLAIHNKAGVAIQSSFRMHPGLFPSGEDQFVTNIVEVKAD